MKDGVARLLLAAVLLASSASALLAQGASSGSISGVVVDTNGGGIPGAEIRTAIVNGAAGAVVTVRGEPYAVIAFTVRSGRISEINAIVGRSRVRRIAAAVLG